LGKAWQKKGWMFGGGSSVCVGNENVEVVSSAGTFGKELRFDLSALL
jgi:hypothetical protein